MTSGERKLIDLLVPEATHRSGEPLTAVMIDGNSIAAMAGTFRGGTLRVTHCEHVEMEKLVEVTRRLRHPIFMDVSFAHFPERDLARARLAEILARPEFANPVVILLASDKVRVEQLTGEATEEAANERATILLKGCLPFNPYEFPALVRYDHGAVAGDGCYTRLMVLRLADIIPLIQLVREAGGRYFACASAMGAAANVAHRLHRARNTPGALVLSDLGKLRTLYTMVREGHPPIWSSIPVGLARDDVHYFKSIALSAEKLQTLERQIGRLLFPPEATPSPLFSGFASSPQIDCTRFAIQVSRYAQRCTDGLRRDGTNDETHFMTGRASRLPGLRSYIEARLHTKVRRLDRRPIPGVELDDTLAWAHVGDNMLLAGALLEALDPGSNSLPLLQQRIHSPPQRAGVCTISKMKPATLYVYEQKAEME